MTISKYKKWWKIKTQYKYACVSYSIQYTQVLLVYKRETLILPKTIQGMEFVSFLLFLELSNTNPMSFPKVLAYSSKFLLINADKLILISPTKDDRLLRLQDLKSISWWNLIFSLPFSFAQCKYIRYLSRSLIRYSKYNTCSCNFKIMITLIKT